jgi:signal peptidase II
VGRAHAGQHQTVPLLGESFRLTHSTNTGVAFGALAGVGHPWLLVLTGAIITGMAAWLFLTVRRRAAPATVWPLGAIVGGALANFFDRLPDGRVTDFLDAGIGAARWPSFNLADSAIVLGVIALFVASYRGADGAGVPGSHGAPLGTGPGGS